MMSGPIPWSRVLELAPEATKRAYPNLSPPELEESVSWDLSAACEELDLQVFPMADRGKEPIPDEVNSQLSHEPTLGATFSWRGKEFVVVTVGCYEENDFIEYVEAERIDLES